MIFPSRTDDTSAKQSYLRRLANDTAAAPAGRGGWAEGVRAASCPTSFQPPRPSTNTSEEFFDRRHRQKGFYRTNAAHTNFLLRQKPKQYHRASQLPKATPVPAILGNNGNDSAQSAESVGRGRQASSSASSRRRGRRWGSRQQRAPRRAGSSAGAPSRAWRARRRAR